MKCRQTLPIAVLAVLVLPAGAQIATSNEDGATGAYSSEVDSSFTSEGRFGPRTAIDDLRADVDRDREKIEKVRMKQLRETTPATAAPIEPYVPVPQDTEADSGTEAQEPE